MSYYRRPLGLIFLVLMIILGLQAGFKKPLCIDSNIVYKIDRISDKKNETIYNCREFKKVTFSKFFYENLAGLESRLRHIEFLLTEMGVRGAISIKIDNINTTRLQMASNTIIIGLDILDFKHLEKATTFLILKNKSDIQDSIYLQTLADFFVSDNAYQNLISEAFSKSIERMNVFEKRKLTKKIMSQLKNKSELADMTTIEKLKSSLAEEKSIALFDKSLTSLGYIQSQEIDNLKLDIIISSKSLVMSEIDLADIAKNNPTLKVGIENSEGLFILPAYFKIPKNSEKHVFARYRVIFDTPGGIADNILQYVDNTERLVSIKGALSLKDSDFIPLLKYGVSQFLAKNKHLDFVQIHLPSFKLKSKALLGVSDYFKFVSNKNSAKSEYKALGWSETKWSVDLQAFKPVANFDVIQYFRIN
jgi:hypothetical protein